MKLLVVMLLAAMLVPIATADWLQAGGDAARTGVAAGQGPHWNDVVLTLPVPMTSGSRVPAVNPIVIAGTIYFSIPGSLSTSSTLGEEQLASVVYAVDLGAPDIVEFARFDWPLYHLTSDGERLFASGSYRVVAWDLSSRELWGDEFLYHLPPEIDQETGYTGAFQKCGPPALTADALLVACLNPTPRYDNGDIIVGAFDPTTLAPLWERPWDSATSARPVAECLTDVMVVCVDSLDVDFLPSYAIRPPSAAVVSGWAYVAQSHREMYSSGGVVTGGYELHAIDLEEGEGRILESWWGTIAGTVSRGAWHVPAPSGNDEVIFTKARELRQYQAAFPTYREFESVPIREQALELDLGSGFALRGERLYVTSLTQLHLFDTALDADPTFVTFTLPAGEGWDAGPLVLTDDLVIGRATRMTSDFQPTNTILYALDARTGGLVWRHAFDGPTEIGASDGVVVALDTSGILTVLGHTSHSPQPRFSTSTRYPAVGGLVQVDLGASEPGLQGPVTAYRIEWGDGHIAGWQEEANFEHRFAEAVDRHARFFVRNDAGQTASIPMTFHVGQRDPFVNIFNSPFSDEYQETTFFFLGLLITAIVATFGIYRAGRKRRRLHKELRDLEAAYKDLHHEAISCEAMLAERRSLARSLFLEKRLEEAHSSFLEKRIDDMQRSLRSGLVDEQLRFLSHGLVLRIKRILADARVDAVERADFLDALARERLPTKEREQVRQLIEGWFLRDEEART